MRKRSGLVIINLILSLGVFVNVALAQKAAQTSAPSSTSIKWDNALKQKPEWYASDEAVRIADNLLLYQRDS